MSRSIFVTRGKIKKIANTMTQKTNKNRHVSSLANATTAIPTSGHVAPGEIGSFMSANKPPNQLRNTTQAVGSASALSGRIGRRVKALGEADALAGARNPFLPRDMIPRPGLRQVAESETMEAWKRRQDSKPTSLSSARAARNIVREDGVDDAIFSEAATPEGQRRRNWRTSWCPRRPAEVWLQAEERRGRIFYQPVFITAFDRTDAVARQDPKHGRQSWTSCARNQRAPPRLPALSERKTSAAGRGPGTVSVRYANHGTAARDRQIGRDRSRT